MQKVFNIQYNILKTTFKPIQQLSCFVGQPVQRDCRRLTVSNPHFKRSPSNFFSEKKWMELYFFFHLKIEIDTRIVTIRD